MLRLAIKLDNQETACRAAASRIREVAVVEEIESADALVTDRAAANTKDKPVLWLGREPAANGLNVFPAFPWRFEPSVLAIRQSLDAGNLGKPALMRLHVWSPPSQPQNDSARIAGADLALWLFGGQPDAAFSASHPNGLEVIHLGFRGGGMALLDFLDTLPEGDSYRSLSVIGSRGAAYAEDHRDRNLLFAGGPPGASAPDSTHAFMRPMLEDFVAAVRSGRDSTEATRSLESAVNAVRLARQSRA